VLSNGLWQAPVAALAPAAPASNITALGMLTFSEYAYPLQVAGVILLVAIIAAIALTLRRRKDTKQQRPSEQVRVRRADRVRVVAIASDADARQDARRS
jgi:NADH-quinone oxidoreductase subunit J